MVVVEAATSPTNTIAVGMIIALMTSTTTSRLRIGSKTRGGSGSRGGCSLILKGIIIKLFPTISLKHFHFTVKHSLNQFLKSTKKLKNLFF